MTTNRYISPALIAAASIIMGLLTGCAGNDGSVVHIGKRDNITPAQIVSIDDRLPALHDGIGLQMFGDTMIIKDFMSTDLIFTAYDVVADSCLGSFGMFGNGPGEILQLECPFFDPATRQLYALEQWRVVGFDLDSAVADPGYKAYTKVRIDTVGVAIPEIPKGPVYINDSTIIASRVVPYADRPGYRENAGVFDLTTGLMRSFEELPADEIKCAYAVSPDGEQIVEVGRRNADRIRFFDRKGNVTKTIYGPKYESEPLISKFYYSSPVVTDDRIYVIYYDRDAADQRVSDIIEMDRDGHYIRSFRSYDQLIDLGYNKTTNRLYFSSKGEPQFGYIQL
jgi:hypothetical protein